MKTYSGDRLPDGTTRVRVREAGGSAVPLRHVVYHSPTGLEWGYAGSGPADLALSVLADYLGATAFNVSDLWRGFENLVDEDDPRAVAWRWHQPFKHEVIARFDGARWELTGDEIAAWLEARA